MRKLLAFILALAMAALPAAAMAEAGAEENFYKGYEAWQAKDYTSAMGYWRQAADQGLADAQYNLGYMYLYGEGVDQSCADAAEFFRMAASQGHASAQNLLGRLYRDGNGVEQSYEKAAEYFRQAADQGNVDAQVSLAIAYITGRGVDQSYEQAMEYFRLAADQGSANAQFNLGLGYERGEGVEQSWEQAAEYYRLAADQGYTDAQTNLAQCYEEGRGVEQSWEQAAEYYRLAADQGDADAQLRLGYAYENGRGVEKSGEKAVEYYRLSADQGNAYAQYNLGICYELGEGVEQSYDQAVEYYRQAAGQGNADAQFNLGCMYLDGKGVEQSYEQAAAYFRQAADQGNGSAQYNLGSLYALGEGVEQSWEQAAAYFRQAADQGVEEAAKKLEAAEQNLKIASAPVPDAMREQAIAAGMDVPAPGDGEALYVGVGDVPDTQRAKLYLAFIVTPGGRSIRRIVMLGEALEVPVEGGDPCLIVTQRSTLDGLEFDLDPGETDITLGKDPPISIAGLKLEDDSATCALTLSGSYQEPEAGIDGSYTASADIALLRITGDTALAAIDPPTREEAEAAGMKLPEPGEGEALYLGAAKVPQAEKVYVAFVLSADGASLSQLTVQIQNMEIEYKTPGASTKITSSKSFVTVPGQLEIAPEIESGRIRLSGLEIDGDMASAVLHYTYHADKDNFDVPFDAAHVAFARVK